MNEIELIGEITRWAAARQQRGDVVLGIGDDCAVFRPRKNEDLLLKTDPMIEDVHFRRALDPRVVGQRALGRNLSDIAAMGGEARACVVSLAIPKEINHDWVKRFYQGLLQLAKKYGAVLAGGHLAIAEKIHIDVTVIGEVPRGKALRRDGAKFGDLLYVSGRLGKSWERPIQPRLTLGQKLLGRASSCIDISDGLALDLHRLCLASGKAAILDNVPRLPGVGLERALHGGEDYELLFTMSARKVPPRGAIRIGTIAQGTPGAISWQGKQLAPRGFQKWFR